MKAENPNSSRNVARFFVNNRQIAAVALLATLAWGVFGYMNMPKRKDPDIPVRIALAITPWPGISADKVEQLVTRKVEQAITGNSKVDRVESTTQDNISVVQVRLLDNIKNTQQEFQDIGQRLNQITDLPDGAGPVTWISDFGDTAALMLTVASPTVPDLEIALRARGVQNAVEKVRQGKTVGRVAVLYCYPASVSPAVVDRPFLMLAAQVVPASILRRRSRMNKSAHMDASSSRRDCKSMTFIPTRGARLSFAIHEPPRTVSRKWRATAIPIANWMTLLT
jgi:hypothetical protein